MADNKCITLCATGEQCSRNKNIQAGDGLRCRTHHGIYIRTPNHVTRRQLTIKHKNEKKIDEIAYMKILVDTPEINHNIIRREYRNTKNTTKIRHTEEMLALCRVQRAEIDRTGIDPDAGYRARFQIAHDRIRPLYHPQPQPQQPVRGLEAFARDNQNVHTTEAVNQTKAIVERVRKILVPEDYRWNTLVVSKTIGEIIAECRLSSFAAAQMFNQYVSSTAIYDIEEGIYGKVLDSVWQYIKMSPDKEDLCKILKNEMIDNISMCAQGNLSRICNILSGYLDGIGSQESLSERLGRLLAPLMNIEDDTERIMTAYHIMEENDVPRDEWNDWVEPLITREKEESLQELLYNINTAHYRADED